MKKLNIFKSGKHISAAGASLEFTEQDLAATVAAYNPETHEAPIVVGHPKDNNPAYGWVSGLSFSEETGLEAETSQVDEDFTEMVNAGRFKKISASFYTPESPNNPVPGVYYLRHVGFLGAQPPAVKGLRDASFNEAEAGVVEFSDWNDIQNASLWRKMREWIIGKYDVEEADNVIPSYMVETLEEEARKPIEDIPAPQPLNNFKEGEAMTPEEIAAMKAENERLQVEAEANTQKNANFAEREAALAAQETLAAKQNSDSFIDGLVAAGKVLPAQKGGLSEFMQSLDETVAVEFSEDDKAVSKPQTELFKNFLEAMPKLVDFKELSHEDGHKDASAMTSQQIADKAQDFMEEELKKGREVSISTAVAHILK